MPSFLTWALPFFRRGNFPVREGKHSNSIKNTNRPEDTGTVIRETADGDTNEHLITGIAGKEDSLAIHAKKVI